jgi:hypothetical protein
MKAAFAFLAMTIAPAAAFAPQSTTPSHLHKSISKIHDVAGIGANVCPRAASTALFGIPKMFRWLTDQYPNINSRLNEGLGTDKIVDNFYLDMNGIIHPCTHGNSDEIVVLDETAMFKKIFSYVDR